MANYNETYEIVARNLWRMKYIFVVFSFSNAFMKFQPANRDPRES